MQGRVRLDPEGRKLLWHLVARWNDLVRSRHNPKVAASTNRIEGRFDRFKSRARLTRGLKTAAGARHFGGLMARGPNWHPDNPLAGWWPVIACNPYQRD